MSISGGGILRRWGDEKKTYGLKKKKKLLSYLKEALDLPELKEKPKVRLQDIKLPDTSISDDLLAEIKSFITASDDLHDRITHSMGKSYKDLIRVRKGYIKQAPDIVAYPKSAEEIEKGVWGSR